MVATHINSQIPSLLQPHQSLQQAQGTSEPSHCGQKVLGMKLGVTCLLWLLLICLTLPTTHSRVLERSMEIRSKENMSKGLSPANPLPPAPSASPDSAAFRG